MPTIHEGDLICGDLKLAFVVSRFNSFITARLLEGALDVVKRHGGDPDHAAVAYVPGSFELPLAASKFAQSGKYDAVVCLGCVIRGATGHFDHVAGESAKGIAQVMLETGVPVALGVITADTVEQAVERAGSKQGNYGAAATLTAIEMANLLKSL